MFGRQNGDEGACAKTRATSTLVRVASLCQREDCRTYINKSNCQYILVAPGHVWLNSLTCLQVTFLSPRFLQDAVRSALEVLSGDKVRCFATDELANSLKPLTRSAYRLIADVCALRDGLAEIFATCLTLTFAVLSFLFDLYRLKCWLIARFFLSLMTDGRQGRSPRFFLGLLASSRLHLVFNVVLSVHFLYAFDHTSSCAWRSHTRKVRTEKGYVHPEATHPPVPANCCQQQAAT